MMIAPPGQASDSTADILALFAEARRRQRRRRLAAAAVILSLAGLVAISLAGGGARHDPARRARPAPRAAVIVKPRVPRFTLPAAQVAWVDYYGQLHFGDVATGAQHVVATIRSDAGGWFVAAAGHVYWPDFSRNSGPIRGYDLATGKTQRLGRGERVFAAPGGRHLYLTRSATRLVEIRTGQQGGRRMFDVPPGWRLNCCMNSGTVAGGVIVNSAAGGGNARVASWDPRNGRIRPLGMSEVIDDVYTPPGGRSSLIAWQPTSTAGRNGPVNITSTATLATVTVRSPLRHGFTVGDGTFSPDGKTLAVFVRRAGISSSWPNHSELALINTRTGALRVVRAVRLVTEEDTGWVLWLPGGQRLLAGALLSSYAVDAGTLAARPFSFFRGTEHDIMDTPAINFSAAVISARDARRAHAGWR